MRHGAGADAVFGLGGNSQFSARHSGASRNPSALDRHSNASRNPVSCLAVIPANAGSQLLLLSSFPRKRESILTLAPVQRSKSLRERESLV
jgi:hypothetical protein